MLPLDTPPPDLTASYTSPIAPAPRWGGVREAEGQPLRTGTDGKLYTEEHATINAERAHAAEAAARHARQVAGRRLAITIALAVVLIVVVIALVAR
jgi:hypothetical protein